LKPEISGVILDEPSVNADWFCCAALWGDSAGLIGPHTVQISPLGFAVATDADLVVDDESEPLRNASASAAA
jgi:hypothetical protein